MTGTETKLNQPNGISLQGMRGFAAICPGTDNLKCPYCGFENRIQIAPPAPVPFLDFWRSPPAMSLEPKAR